MNKRDLSRFVIITYVFSYLLSLAYSELPTNSSFISLISQMINASTIILLCWLCYMKWGWRKKILKHLMYRPNLNGTWYGRYSAEDISTKKIFNGSIAFRIKQNLFGISVISFTENYSNSSYSEELFHEEKSDESKIIYVYAQEGADTSDLSKRDGACELVLKNIRNRDCLHGKFWTAHGTKGKLNVSKISETQVDSFHEAEEIAARMEL